MKSNFKKVLSDTIYDVREGICKKLEHEVMRFEDVIEGLKSNFSVDLLSDIQDELSTIIDESSDKEEKIKKYDEIIKTVERLNANLA